MHAMFVGAIVCMEMCARGEVERGMEMGRTCMHALATHPLTPLPAQWGETALDLAKNDEVKTALCEHGAKHSLLYAADKGMVELVADLIKEGADVNEKNRVSLNCVLSAYA